LANRRIIDVEDEQIPDLCCVSKDENKEILSSGHTTYYNGKLFLSTSDVLYPSRSNLISTIVADQVVKHIMLYALCSKEMFAKSYGATTEHRNCFDNLAINLEKYGIRLSRSSIPFNIFMNIDIYLKGEKQKIHLFQKR